MKPAEYAANLKEAMVANTTVKELFLAKCDIRDDSAEIIGNMLKENHTLEVGLNDLTPDLATPPLENSIVPPNIYGR